jgi:hypothetical protein
MMLLKADDGVSESLGFVLIALVLTMTMAAILMIGYPIYQESINEGHMKNMEEGFYLLSANANKVALYESPVQSSEIKLYGGVLSMENDGYIKIFYKRDIGGIDVWNDVHSGYPITNDLQIMEYSLYNQQVAYVMGGVFRNDGSGQVLLKDPLTYQYPAGTAKTVVMPLIQNDNLRDAVAGAELSRIEFKNPSYSRETSTLIYPKSDRIENVKEVKIKITSKYNDALSRYFIDRLGFHIVSNDPGDPAEQVTLDKNYYAEVAGNTVTLYVPHCELYTTIA